MNDLHDPTAGVTLDSKVAFLRLPASFPEPGFRVEAIETHMSWVFLTDCFAYKLKKPVRYDGLDFASIEARRHFCEEEVRLNRRLAADVYVGTVALTLAGPGHLQFDGTGPVVDWLVKMRRLPRQRMLDYAIVHGSANADDMRAIAARLVEVYRAGPAVALDAAAFCARLLAHIDDTMQAMAAPAYGLGTAPAAVFQAQKAFVQRDHALFEARIAASKIVEGHGDLRPEHICLAPPAIIDCLEFSRQLRILDPIDDIGFLALECERLGAAHLGAALMAAYCDIGNDSAEPRLLRFYQSYRAGIRARIAIGHLDEAKFRYSAEWPRRAGQYLSLAQSKLADAT